MATLRQYFDTDFNESFRVGEFYNSRGEGIDIKVDYEVVMDIFTNTKFIKIFIPANINMFSVCYSFLFKIEEILETASKAQISTNINGQMVSSADLNFSGKVIFYCENSLTEQQINHLRQEARKQNLIIQFYDDEYAKQRSSSEKPLAFISHDSRDKESVALPLAQELIKRMCPVWYDEYSLKIGDNLRESIEKGIKECKKCIVILSPHFIENPGWTKMEFDSIFSRELVERSKLILPVWHGVSKQDVFDYSPRLAIINGLNTEKESIKNIASKICYAIKTSHSQKESVCV